MMPPSFSLPGGGRCATFATSILGLVRCLYTHFGFIAMSSRLISASFGGTVIPVTMSRSRLPDTVTSTVS